MMKPLYDTKPKNEKREKLANKIGRAMLIAAGSIFAVFIMAVVILSAVNFISFHL